MTKREWQSAAIMIGVLAFVAFAAFVWGHGSYCDFVADQMHGRDCYWCNVYRFVHMSDAAFEMREYRRNGGGK